MSKNLLLPKSPLAVSLLNLPVSKKPINLKFFRFSDKGAFILFRSISISLLILEKLVLFPFWLINLGIFVPSNSEPIILIFLSKNIEKSLFFFPSSYVLAENFFKNNFIID